MRSRIHALPAFVLLTMPAWSELGAQQRDTSRTDTTRVLEAVSVTEAREALVAGGASAVVLKTESVRGSAAPVLEHALRETPFTHLRRNSRGETEISVRGSESRQAAVLLDGVPLSLGWDHRADASLIPLTGAERVVIVRGLATLLNGPNTLGGTLEIDRLSPVAPGATWWAGTGLESGAGVDATAGGSVSRLRGRRSAVVRAGASVRRRAGLPLPGDVIDTASRDGLRTNSDHRQWDAFLAAQLASSSGASLTASVAGYDARRGVPPELHVRDPRLWRYPTQAQLLVTASARTAPFPLAGGYTTLLLAGGFRDGDVRLESFSDMRYRTVSGVELGSEQTTTVRAAALHARAGGGTIGASATMARIGYEETVVPAVAATYRQRIGSVAAEADAPLPGGTRLAFGAALDHASTPETGGRPRQPALSAWGVRAGASHAFDDLKLHASVSRRARFPALRELYSGALNRFAPNPALRPERLLGVEAGLTMDRRMGRLDDVVLQGVGFHHDLRDAVVRVTLPDRRFQRVNRDRLRSTGVELLAGAALGRRRPWTAQLDATLQRVTLADTAREQRRPEHQPGLRARLELGIPLAHRLRGSVTGAVVGDQHCVHPDLGEQRLPPQQRWHAAIQRAPATVGRLRAMIALGVDNVFDQTGYDQCGLPQSGRLLRLVVRFSGAHAPK